MKLPLSIENLGKFITILLAVAPETSSRRIEKEELEIETCGYTSVFFPELLQIAEENTLLARKQCCESELGKKAFNLGPELRKNHPEEEYQLALDGPSGYVGIQTKADWFKLRMGLYLFTAPACTKISGCYGQPENPGTENYLCL